MALNLLNPSVVMSIYSSILNHEYNWLLLHYTNDSYDGLALHSYGVEGLEELKTRLSNLQEVFIAFYREEDVNAGYIIINYIPSSVSGVKRARVLVHSRRVGLVFKKHQAIYTVDSLSLITSHNVHQAITDPEAALSSPTRHSPLQLAGATDKPLPEREHGCDSDPIPHHLGPSFESIRSATRESPKGPAGNDTTRHSSSDILPHLPVVRATSYVTDLLKGGSLFKLLKHKRKQDDFLREMKSPLAPQTPPKDVGDFGVHPMLVICSDIGPSKTDKMLQRRSSRISDFAVISHARDSEDVVVLNPDNHDLHLHASARLHPLPLRGKWAHKDAIPTDPVERAHQRREVQLQREREEREFLREEAERQRQLKLEKERILRQEKEEEAQRLAEVEKEISRIRLERKRREQSEKEEEEEQRRELEDRKRRDRKRRLEEHQRLEEWRRQQARKLEAAARQADEIQRREEAIRRDKIQFAEDVVKQIIGERELTGWITIQSRDAISWRRRYFKFVGPTIHIYRSAEGRDMIAPLEEINLQGSVGGLKEWYEGYEDLEAIPFSVVVEFKNGREPLSMYADCEEEKVSVP